MIVLKFGGTSVGDAESMKQVLRITEPYISQGALLVSSAMSGVTNTMVSLAENIRNNESQKAQKLIEDLENKHYRTLTELLDRVPSIEDQEKLGLYFLKLRALVKGSLLLRECSVRVYDALLSTGELLSTTLLLLKAQEMAWNVKWVDSRRLIKTDSNYGNAGIDWEGTKASIGSEKILVPGQLTIAQGFIGSDANQVTTTLGRGGSDYSAAVYGSVLGVKEIQIWTDVDGILTTDPRIVQAAQTIPEISYSEAAELAYFGAKVVHPSTIQPAVERKIPVYVKNTKNPQHQGTKIHDKAPGKGLRAIAGKKAITLITVESSRMLNAYGFLSRIFTIFNHYQTPVDLVATSEVSVSMTIEDTSQLKRITQDLEDIGDVKISSDNAILCLVGPKLWKESSFVTEVFGALHFTNLKLITLGSSDINLSMVIPASDLGPAIAGLHKKFFEVG